MEFLSTPSARRATVRRAEEHLDVLISIHALREEGDLSSTILESPRRSFLSTPSARRATDRCRNAQAGYRISIHALREEGDPGLMARMPRRWNNFYPRPPRGGRRETLYDALLDDRFLSTPSARRATLRSPRSVYGKDDFYPRPPRGGRRPMYGTRPPSRKISIHALREEGDMPSRCSLRSGFVFLSTPSARRATS